MHRVPDLRSGLFVAQQASDNRGREAARTRESPLFKHSGRKLQPRGGCPECVRNVRRRSPCVNACPVEPDPKTGRRALYRDETTHTVHNDAGRCIGCGSCAEACAAQRTGVISIDPATERPEGICTLCGGDPQCVKWCPFEALSYAEVKPDRKYHGLAPEKIAAELAKNWYGTADLGGLK